LKSDVSKNVAQSALVQLAAYNKSYTYCELMQSKLYYIYSTLFITAELIAKKTINKQ